MVEDVNHSFTVAITVMLAGALLASTVNILVMCNAMLSGFGDKVIIGTSSSSEGTVVAVTGTKSVAMPVIYGALEQSSDAIDRVYIGQWTDTDMLAVDEWSESVVLGLGGTQIYAYNDPDMQNLIDVLTRYHNKVGHVRLWVSEDNPAMSSVFIGWR